MNSVERLPVPLPASVTILKQNFSSGSSSAGRYSSVFSSPTVQPGELAPHNVQNTSQVKWRSHPHDLCLSQLTNQHTFAKWSSLVPMSFENTGSWKHPASLVLQSHGTAWVFTVGLGRLICNAPYTCVPINRHLLIQPSIVGTISIPDIYYFIILPLSRFFLFNHSSQPVLLYGFSIPSAFSYCTERPYVSHLYSWWRPD